MSRSLSVVSKATAADSDEATNFSSAVASEGGNHILDFDCAVVEEREIPQRKGVRRDQVIFFYKLARAGVDCFFRRVEYYDEKTANC